MPRVVRVASVDEIHTQAGTLVRVDEEEIAIFLRDGVFYALSNVCAHQHFSLLHKGMLEGCTITCPMHGWTYDMKTGKSTSGQGKVATYPVSIRGSDVFIELPSKE
jgi:nitrite reductase/ring-hydroxylating ferredoxin subunit